MMKTMVRQSKWIEGAKPGKPVTDVARTSLHGRLDSVWHYAPLAAKRADNDIEYVHQLRVSSRRATAALQLYEGLLPPKKAKRINKLLHRLRKAAGDARDLDVLSGRLAAVADRKNKSDLDAVLKLITARRKEAQQPLVQGYMKARQKEFSRRSGELIDGLRWRDDPPEPIFFDFARAMFRPLVDAFFSAAGADLSDVTALHQMRICGKQVRYAMELLAGAFSCSFRDELYPVFGEVQEKLGTINDHATAITLLDEWMQSSDFRQSQAALGELIAEEKQGLAEARQSFLNWWTAEHAAALAHQFDAALQDTRDQSTKTADPKLDTIHRDGPFLSTG
jgi:CHAD domain-containing protein